jgi:hypothetical protein
VLQWAREQGCPWGVETCRHAAQGGHLAVLQWALEQDPPCPWQKWNTCLLAANGGHVEVLQWAREHSCPWGSEVCLAATRDGHLDVLRWARAQGCPSDTYDLFRSALEGRDEETLRWMRAEGLFDGYNAYSDDDDSDPNSGDSW